jgi:raffinose/stachyose/melibiose transport system substrate-binding protein
MYTGLKRLLPLLLILGLLVAACAAPAAGPQSGEDGAPAKVQITFWQGTSVTADCIIAVAVDSFNEQSDTIEVNAEKKANMMDAVRPALAAGAGPDIVPTHGPSFVAEFALADQLMPLDDLSDQFGWEDLFVPWALNLGRVQGTLYSLPQELETMVLFYNKTVFEEHGWEPPTTMDELEALSAQIQEAGIIPFAGGAADAIDNNEFFFTEFVNKIAGPEKVYQALKGEIPWTDPDFVTAIETLNRMFQAGYWMGSPANFLVTDFSIARAAFATGEAAMTMEGTWIYDSLVGEMFTEDSEHGNDWDWVPMPSLTGEAMFNIGTGSTQSINRSSEHPEAAAEFLTYYNSPEIQSRLLVECQSATAPIRLDPAQLEGVEPRMAHLLAEFAKASVEGHYGYTTWTFFPPKTDQVIYEEIEKVWVGDMTPEEYMAAVDAAFQEELQAGETLVIPDR